MTSEWLHGEGEGFSFSSARSRAKGSSISESECDVTIPVQAIFLKLNERFTLKLSLHEYFQMAMIVEVMLKEMSRRKELSHPTLALARGCAHRLPIRCSAPRLQLFHTHVSSHHELVATSIFKTSRYTTSHARSNSWDDCVVCVGCSKI